MRIDWAVGSNSRDSDSGVRPERARATICSRNSGEYGALVFDIVGSSFPKDQVPTKPGQLQIIHFVGVWDTVGALGIPTRVLAFVDQHDLFYDVELGTNVKVARHAVAMDEKRTDFEPTLWSKKEAVSIKQVWFAGVHRDVGGGYAPRGGKLLRNIPLAWMVREAEDNGLSFEAHLQENLNEDHTASAHRSYKGFYKFLGAKVREIPEGAAVHSSVKLRYKNPEKGPEPLRKWLKANSNARGPIEE